MQDHSQPDDAPSVDAWESVVEYGGPAARRPQARPLPDKDPWRGGRPPVSPDDEDDGASDVDRFAEVAEGVLGRLVEEVRVRLDAAETALRDEVAGLREQLSTVSRGPQPSIAEMAAALKSDLATLLEQDAVRGPGREVEARFDAALAEHRRGVGEETVNAVQTALAAVRDELRRDREQAADANELLLGELAAVRAVAEH